jgi:hypothetical protein
MASRVGMRVGQLCSVLESLAKIHDRLGAHENAAGLRSVSSALRPREQVALSKFTDDVKKLRASGGKKMQRGHESA